MSDIAAIVERLIGAGAEPAVAALCVVEAYEIGLSVADMSAGLSTGHADNQREKWRLQKAAQRANLNKTKQNPEANDAGTRVVVQRTSRTCPPDIADKRCDLSSLLTEDDKGIREESKKEAGSEVVALAKRGTRLRSDAPLSDADRQFAIEHGCPDPSAFWVEFVDYWIAVPGQRGTKLDWPATWRNRVREKFSKTGGQNGRRAFGAKPSLASRAYDLADRVEQRESSEGFAGPPVYVRGG